MTPDTGPGLTPSSQISVPESGEAGKEGLVEDLKGKAKDVIGQVTGKEDLEREGEAQQERAAAEREVAQKEAEVERARAQATKHEAEERAHQD